MRHEWLPIVLGVLLAAALASVMTGIVRGESETERSVPLLYANLRLETEIFVRSDSFTVHPVFRRDYAGDSSYVAWVDTQYLYTPVSSIAEILERLDLLEALMHRLPPGDYVPDLQIIDVDTNLVPLPK